MWQLQQTEAGMETVYILINTLIQLAPQSPLNPTEGDFLYFFVYFLSPFGGYGGLFYNTIG